MKKLLFLIFLTAPVLWAQAGNRSVAIVGNRVILESDVNARLSGTASYQDVLTELVFENMLIFEANREGIKVSGQEVEAEIKRVIGGFPSERAFMEYLESMGISYRSFRNMIENRIKTNKLIRQKVSARIDIRHTEITEEIRQIKSSAGKVFLFSLKWFDSEDSASGFTAEFDETSVAEMAALDWIKQEDILPEILDKLLELEEGGVSAPIIINERYLVVFLRGVRRQQEYAPAELYARARERLHNRKFNEKFDNYMEELRSRIPVFLSE